MFQVSLSWTPHRCNAGSQGTSFGRSLQMEWFCFTCSSCGCC